MVKPGYKQTEIGVLPESWKIVSLASLSIGGMQNGAFYEVSRKGKGVSFLNVADLYGFAPIQREKLQKFDATEKEIERFMVKNGDLLFTRSSIVPQGIAFCNWFSGSDDEITIFDSHVIRFKTDLSQVIPMYLYLQCIAPSSRKYFISNAKTATMTTIDQEVLGNCKIALPTIHEQRNIAEAITDIDALTANLEKLIAKKKAIKQGAMQELLTGKRRLLGFEGDWRTHKFGDIFDILPNNAFTRAEMSVTGIVKNIHYGDILTKYPEYICAESDEIPFIESGVDLSRFSEKCYVKSGDVIIADTAEDETVGKATEIIKVDRLILSGQHTLLCRPKIAFAERFLGYYLNSSCYHDQLIPYITGTKVSSISRASITQTILRVPTIREQAAIADILTDMDNEIKELEQKLAKYRLVKQGMMSELLTGRIRLV